MKYRVGNMINGKETYNAIRRFPRLIHIRICIGSLFCDEDAILSRKNRSSSEKPTPMHPYVYENEKSAGC